MRRNRIRADIRNLIRKMAERSNVMEDVGEAIDEECSADDAGTSAELQRDCHLNEKRMMTYKSLLNQR